MTNAPSTTGDAAAVLRRAAELEDHDWNAAIALLDDANKKRASDEIEHALVRLRQRCSTRLAPGPVRADPPIEPSACPLVGPSGLPELRIDELTTTALRAAIASHGCLLVRGAVDGRRVDQLVELIDLAFVAHDEQDHTRWYRPLDMERIAREQGGKWRPGTRRWIRAGGGVLLCDTPRLMFEVLELYEELGLYAVIREHLGSRPVLSANKCTARRVAASAPGSWHQDGAFLGREIRAMNVWLALTDCGVDAPGLDIVARRFDGIVETGATDTYFTWSAGDAAVSEAAGAAAIVRPRFAAGDLLLFDHLLMHRTAVDPAMTRERHAIEFWSFSAAAYPSGEIPIVW